MAYTTIDKPSDYFETLTWTGDGTTKDITGVGFQPDWVWAKKRSATGFHALADSVRGGTKNIFTNSSGAEETSATDWILSFASDGFGVNSGGNLNQSSATYVAWNWLAGTSVSGNTGGSGTAKTYSGSVNTTSGFSIINFVGNGTAGHTIPHHLGVAPKMVIVKNRTSGSTNWQTYHYSLDDGAGTHEIFLDSTGATNASAGAWNNTAPTSTVITKGTGSYGNENNSNHIMYSFAEKKGYSKFGSYTGNGNADGTFVYTGFKPAWFMVKRTNASGNPWIINDNKRDPFNFCRKNLFANASDAEVDVTSESGTWDLLSNGVKMRNSGTSLNGSGSSYIYMAFAESPFVTAGTKAAGTAR